MPPGGVWTALRNGPGSFALFGTSALVSYECFGLADAKQASFIQTSVASCAGKYCVFYIVMIYIFRWTLIILSFTPSSFLPPPSPYDRQWTSISW